MSSPQSPRRKRATVLGAAAVVIAIVAAVVVGVVVTRPGSSHNSSPCEAVARSLQPKGARLTSVATTIWQGTPADVFAFRPPGVPATSAPGRQTPRRVYVLARSDCHLLVFQSYAP